ncbi:uncharacterized protein [Montipora foliosa]|uniref:uncharacterized protein n=1 Tax=Montipora foliosa TaxID=591990 RepID=UPI0035F1C9D8
MNFFLLLAVCASVNLDLPTLVNAENISTVIPAERICKTGPPLAKTPGKFNCLVIGDSISIGYTPWLVDNLGETYQVQHAPWEEYDGGALDSKYGLQCLDLFLSTVMLEPTNCDVIVFNFGLHDLNFNGKLPEEFNTPFKYENNLRRIKSILLSTGAKVGFLLTTPVPFENALNARICKYNRIASHVMKEHPEVETVDLYDWVIKGHQNKCYESDKDLNPHFTNEGYKYISRRVKDLILNLTKKCKSNNYTREANHWFQGKPVVPCKDESGHVITVCPHNSTCCDIPFPTGQGCCLMPQAVSCGDGMHCCPAGYRCHESCTSRECFCRKK